MFRLVQLLTRDPDLSHEGFVERWHGDHVEIAEKLPDLRKCTVSDPTRPEHGEYDGVLGTRCVPIACRALFDNVVELYFESEDVMKSALGSDVGHELQQDIQELADMDESPTLYVNEDVRLVKMD